MGFEEKFQRKLRGVIASHINYHFFEKGKNNEVEKIVLKRLNPKPNSYISFMPGDKLTFEYSLTVHPEEMNEMFKIADATGFWKAKGFNGEIEKLRKELKQSIFDLENKITKINIYTLEGSDKTLEEVD